ncbi:MAG: GHKL domain-containing protein [Amphritea sp.]|nr:GHKL domain-containing protein [Amphritea sp.]MBQ0782761.1 GHKL domain-containing protein [Amphritea sp.]
MSQDIAYQEAYRREKKARREAEQLLEDKSRELFKLNNELLNTNNRLKEQQSLMLRNEKLATLGTLSAGIAHEINNPLAFVLSNMESLRRYINSYNALLKLNRQWQEQQNLSPSLSDQLQTLLDEQDLIFIQEDTEELLTDTEEGLIRLRDIVQNLRHFSHSQGSERVKADLAAGLNSTLKILQSELNDSIAVNCMIDSLPLVECNPGELNQVFLNLLINAKQALEYNQNPQIFISATSQDDVIIIRIKDNGSGMDEQVCKKIFDPFFTTKPVGQGTGMGLSIVYGIIKDHNGTINVKSAQGKGTCFEISLPIAGTS